MGETPVWAGARLENPAPEFRARLLDHLPQAVWAATADGQLTYANRRWLSYTGQTLGAALEWGWAAAVHADDLAALLEGWLAAVGRGVTFETECRLRSADGAYRRFEGCIEPLLLEENGEGGETGKIAGWVAVWTNVEARARIEAELTARLQGFGWAARAAERSARLQGVTAALSGALTSAGVAEVVVEQGRAALGAAAGGVMLRNDTGDFEIVRSVGYPTENVEAYRRVPYDSPLPPAVAARGGEAAWFEALPRDADDPDLAAAQARSPNRSAAILPLGYGGTLGALTLSFADARRFSEEDRAFMLALARQAALALERARLHDEVRRLNEDLERRVLDRTRELAARNAELEAKNAEAETFIYTISHDLRQPLLSLSGMAGLLSEAVAGGGADEAAFLISRVERNVGRMGSLLSDLLAFSRAGRLEETAGPVDLGEVVTLALADLEHRLGERGATLELPEGWPAVLYPRAELSQVVGNLLGNAAKFAGRDGEEPRVALSWEAAGGWVTLRVSDNGPGVPPEFREKVFGLFQKMDPNSEGTGVGLAIVKRVVERHGGRAWVEDSPLGGATFAVTLPAGS